MMYMNQSNENPSGHSRSKNYGDGFDIVHVCKFKHCVPPPTSIDNCLISFSLVVYEILSCFIFQLPATLFEHSFVGCVGDVTIDSHKVGLFNFAEKYGDGCEGCVAV